MDLHRNSVLILSLMKIFERSQENPWTSQNPHKFVIWILWSVLDIFKVNTYVFYVFAFVTYPSSSYDFKTVRQQSVWSVPVKYFRHPWTVSLRVTSRLNFPHQQKKK
jgi:hypothetical protein